MSLKNNYKITIPTTNGFIGRNCSNVKCEKYFQIHKDNTSKELVCPYCGEKNPIETMLTQQQANYARDVAAQEIMVDITNEFQNIFKGLQSSNRSSSFLKITTSTKPYQKKHVPLIKEGMIDSEIVCSECEGRFQVYGIFGFCPLCKYENIKIYDANLAIIEREIDNANDKMRALRHSYGDIVSTFENFCKKYSNKNVSINFQNLRNAKMYFKKESKIDIYDYITEQEKIKIKRVFMKRHVYVHSQGIITEQYVKEIPEDLKLLGQKAILSKEELIDGSQILRKVIDNIVNNKS